MKVSLNILRPYLKFSNFFHLIIILALAPVAVFSQSGAASSNAAPAQSARPARSVGDPIWQNGANSNAVGSRPSTTATPVTAGSLSARPASPLGGGPGGGGPGGNPDVPFDANMNLVFLLLGITFAFWVLNKHRKAAGILTTKAK